jgi:hypothetical protein
MTRSAAVPGAILPDLNKKKNLQEFAGSEAACKLKKHQRVKISKCKAPVRARLIFLKR